MKNLLARMALVWQLNLAVASFHMGDGVCFGFAVASFHIGDGVRVSYGDGVRFAVAVASFHMGIASWEIWAKGWEGSRRLLG